MDFYSVTLALALAAAILAAVAAVSQRLWGRAGARTAAGVAAISILLDLASAAQHWAVGHARGSSAALSPGDFLAQHRAFVAVAGLAVAAFLLSRFPRRRRSPQ